MTRWEYCFLSLGADSIFTFTPEGLEQSMYRPTSDKTMRGAIAVALLGREGWELVTSDNDRLFFKRPLAE